MDDGCKKKYRSIADLCFLFGFNLLFFENKFEYIDMFGLQLNIKRCKNIMTASMFKALIMSEAGIMDYQLVDSMSDTGEDIELIISNLKLMLKDK